MLLTTDRLHRVKRLLLDTMRYICASGSYVFDGDPTREAAYTLQHVNDWRNSSKKKPPKSDGNIVSIKTPADDDT